MTVELRDYRIERRRHLTSYPHDRGYVDWVVADLYEDGVRICAVRIADAIVDHEFEAPPIFSSEMYFGPQVVWPPRLMAPGLK